MLLRILVVDDRSDWRVILTNCLEAILKGNGSEVKIETASDYTSAWKKISEETYDLIVVDPMLPDSMEGIWLLNNLAFQNIDIPAIVISVEEYTDVLAKMPIYYPIKGFFNKSRIDMRKFQSSIRTILLDNKENTDMVTPQDQLAVGILLEGTKFLFGELGRRLEFWRNKKEPKQAPEKIEVVHNDSGNLVLKLDDVEKAIRLIKSEEIKSTLKILRTYKITQNSYREDLAKPNLEPTRRAGILVELQDLEDKIQAEGQRLQSLIEQSFKE